jgi:hypothetical protein
MEHHSQCNSDRKTNASAGLMMGVKAPAEWAFLQIFIG